MPTVMIILTGLSFQFNHIPFPVPLTLSIINKYELQFCEWWIRLRVDKPTSAFTDSHQSYYSTPRCCDFIKPKFSNNMPIFF